MVPYLNISMFLLLLNFILLAIVSADISVTHEWKAVDFLWPSNQARENAIKSGRYKPETVAILDVDIWDPSAHDELYDRGHNNLYKKRIFVTTPKFQSGVPVTLSTISSKLGKDGSPLLDPFPDWTSHKEGNCDGLTSVYRVQIDECGKLWVLDTGKLDTFTTTPRKICPPQIVVYDLNKKDKIVARHRFPDNILEPNALPITIVVDTRDKQCSKQYAYIADVNGFKMLVYDSQTKQSWRVVSNHFYPFPTYGTFNINGVSFDLMDGLFGIALGPLSNNDRKVYFHSLASVKEGWTMASTLHNKTYFETSLTPTDVFELSQFDRNSPSTSEVMSEDGILFFPLINSNSLACWNSRTLYKGDNIITLYKNDQTFQFLSGMKLIQNKKLFILTSRLQNYIAGKVDLSQVSYRILTAYISELTRRTQCDVSRSDNSNNGGGYGAPNVHTPPASSPYQGGNNFRFAN